MGLVELNLKDFAEWQVRATRRAMKLLGPVDPDGVTEKLLTLAEAFLARGEPARAFQFLMVFNVQSEPDGVSFEMLTDAFQGIPACDEAVEMFLDCNPGPDPEAN